MEITGVICEYNPLHLGHWKQLKMIRALRGADSGIVCLMSGNFVQRGHPAIIDKMRRAEAAVCCGADLVLELPVTVCLSSAEGFASGGVAILAPFCDYLCFGAETADVDKLLHMAQVLLSNDFPVFLRKHLDAGISFPAARQAALEEMGIDAPLLTTPNNILAVEYCKAILAGKYTTQPMPILREGSYHDVAVDAQNPSATAVRRQMLTGDNWFESVPQKVQSCFHNAQLHSLSAGERAILARLRCMHDTEFEALPHGSEGLWRKFMHATRKNATLEAILEEVKSKRYTRTRLDRMMMCAFLGITETELQASAPYTRVLAFNDRGREILKVARKTGHFPNIGEHLEDPYQILENRCGDLYGLFATDMPEAPGREAESRVIHHK